MKTSKISLVAALALSLTLGLAATSMARPGGGMGGGKMGAMNLTPDQAGKFFDLKEKFHNDTASVRKQIMVKRAELAGLQKAEKPDQAAITAKQAEMKALWTQMKEKRTAFQAEAGKISPDLAQGLAPVCVAARAMAAVWVLTAVPWSALTARFLHAPGRPWRPGPCGSGQVSNPPFSNYSPPAGEGLFNRPLTFFPFLPAGRARSPGSEKFKVVVVGCVSRTINPVIGRPVAAAVLFLKSSSGGTGFPACADRLAGGDARSTNRFIIYG